MSKDRAVKGENSGASPQAGFMTRGVGSVVVAVLALVLAGCPNIPSFPPTVTPIYAATNNGLEIFNGSIWTTYTMKNGLASNTVNCAVVLGTGATAPIIVGTDVGVSLSIDGGATWTNSNSSPSGLPAERVSNIFFGSQIYAATANGVYVSNDASTWAQIPGLSAPVNGVYVVGSTVYAATNAGLSIFDGVAWATYTTGLGSLTVNSVYVDASGFVYASTTGGLSIFDGTPWKNYKKKPDGLGDDNVNSVFVVGSGAGATIYAATSGGLSIGTPTGTGSFTWTNLAGNGIASNTVYEIYIDGASVLYAATAAGLSTIGANDTKWTTALASASLNGFVVTAPLYSF